MRNTSDVLFSLVMPTRNRVDMLANCLYSFFAKAAHPKSVEAILLCDFDDPTMRDFQNVALSNDWNIKIIFQRRSAKMIRDYNNYGSQCSVGKYIWQLNDDYEMTLQHWDSLLHSRIEEFLSDKPDRILYVHVNDSTHSTSSDRKNWGCCCPILSKEAVDIQNCHMPAEIDMWGADVWLYWIYSRLPKNRILNVENEVKVLHHCTHNGTKAQDDISLHVASVSTKGFLTQQEMDHYINLLSRHLK